jgi:hypothetical protein
MIEAKLDPKTTANRGTKKSINKPSGMAKSITY